MHAGIFWWCSNEFGSEPVHRSTSVGSVWMLRSVPYAGMLEQHAPYSLML